MVKKEGKSKEITSNMTETNGVKWKDQTEMPKPKIQKIEDKTKQKEFIRAMKIGEKRLLDTLKKINDSF